MKKFAVLILFLVYSLTSFGLSLNYFYCCGKLKQVSLSLKHTDDNCKGPKGKDCCKYKTVQIKIAGDQQQQPVFAFNVANFSTIALLPAILQNDFLRQEHLAILFKDYGPPPLLPNNLNILFSVFRI